MKLQSALLAGIFAAVTLGCSAGEEKNLPGPDAAMATADTRGPEGKDTGPVADTTVGSSCPNTPDFYSASACNTVENTAPAIAYTPGSGSPPSFTGGPIHDGLYHASLVQGFGPNPSPAGRRATIVVANHATRFYWAGEVLSGSTPIKYSATMKTRTEGNQLFQNPDCVVGAQIPTMSYTATPTELALSVTTGDTVLVTTYTRKGCP